MKVRKVGSSLVKRLSAFERLVWAWLSLGLIDSSMTGSGTNIDVIVTSMVPSVNVSPDAQSTPKSATMSPADASVDVLHLVGVHAHDAADLHLLLGPHVVMVSPLRSVPW
jgi:hypothetical protein